MKNPVKIQNHKFDQFASQINFLFYRNILLYLNARYVHFGRYYMVFFLFFSDDERDLHIVLDAQTAFVKEMILTAAAFCQLTL